MISKFCAVITLLANLRVGTPAVTPTDENEIVFDDPCMEDEASNNAIADEMNCIDFHGVCTFNPESCCDGLKCHGFSFFKHCIEPLVCLEEWQDCRDGTPCCEGLLCALDNGECHKPKIGQRTLTLPPGSETEDVSLTSAPTKAPTKNLKTTKVPGQPVVKLTAGSSGDPHIRTLDGVKYDCQGEGEFILVKSLITQREIQARYEHLSPGRPISWGTGVVVQDEGETPRVQITFARLRSSLGDDVGGSCRVQFFVDGVQRSLPDGSGDERVSVQLRNRNVKILYKESELEVNVSLGNCRMNIFVSVPENDKTVGVLGTPNRDASDEWTTLDGIVIPYDRSQGMKKGGYDFCTQHMCIRDESKSLFVYQEDGVEFQDYQRCDLPYGDTLEKYLTNTPQWVLDLCGSDLTCVIDVSENGADEARLLRLANLHYNSICNPSGGECDNTKCCNGLECVDNGGFAGKVCDGDMQCAPEFGNCEKTGCCDGYQCTQLNNGKSICLEELVCQDQWMSCDSKDCCDGLVCLLNHERGTKQCRKLPTCMRVWEDCSLVGCCGSLQCVDIPNGGRQCQDIPGCWRHRGRDCSIVPCCNGLTCITQDERQFCERLPACVRLGKSCEWSPCCEDNVNPMECVDVVDENGHQGKQCRYIPGEAQISVWNDLNSNGIREDGEPGIGGVKLRLFDDRSKSFLPNQPELTTDVSGIVTFTEVPKVRSLRAVVTDSPRAAVRAPQNRGTDRTKDSDLRADGSTNMFRLSGITLWTNTTLGYILPTDMQVKVFNDVNANGIQDEGDIGLAGVKLRLGRPTKDGFVFLTKEEAAGTASEELVSDENGIVVFSGLPQNQRLSVIITEGPKSGSIPTHRRRGTDRSKDSDLRTDGRSDEFTVRAGEDPNIALGYRMPGSVMVRVWSDSNSNGLQDPGEKGIAGVKLCLVSDNPERTRLPDQKNGGTAHLEVVSDDNGFVTFSHVPQNQRLRVHVLSGPKGAIPTHKKRGKDPTKDSNLGSNGLSDSFTLNSSGEDFSLINLGYRLPNSMIVRVWDDVNNNGIQDEGEPGIKGVKLRLVLDNTARTELSVPDPTATANSELETNEGGFVSFTGVPQNTRYRVKVANAPPGATVAHKRRGTDRDLDSDLNSDGFTDSFTISTEGDFTAISLGYRLPTTMRVRVWDDANYNGIQDEDELGISDVMLCLVRDNTARDRLPDLANGSNSHDEIVTDGEGVATFTGVPKGFRLRVRVVNPPIGALSTHRGRGSDASMNSNLFAVDLTDSFDLASFTGSTFNGIHIGYRMPRDMEVRVWDDVNFNGIQDINEVGIENVILRLVNNNRNRTRVENVGNGGNAHEELVTNSTGMVRFTGIPKGRSFRVQVVNRPPGALPTHANRGKDQESNSNLNSDDTSHAFNLNSFAGEIFRGIHLGFRMPRDMRVRVWDDLNGDGIQDEGEPGIEGLHLCLVQDVKGRPRVENVGGGSNAHLDLTTDEDGVVEFQGIPRGRSFRVQVLNPPQGSRRTEVRRGPDQSMNSNLNNDMTSDRFNMDSFTGFGAFQNIDLGFRMPKTVISRVWNDTNRNGIQDEDEDGIAGVTLRLVQDITGRPNLLDQKNGGNAHEELTTGPDGRVRFTGVPRGTRMRVRVIQPPPGVVGISPASRGGDDQLDSNLESNREFTSSFSLPNNLEDIYDLRDIGFVF